jgi:Tfp pilus assembly PilM family ATPase
MARSFPPDVVILDTDGLLHARLGRGRSSLKIAQAKTYRLAAGTFTPATVTPQLTNEAALAETLRRLRMETGKWEKVSLLLPDSWFRINLLDVPSLPASEADGLVVVRWSLKRTLPIAPEQLRVSYTVLQRTAEGAKVLVVSALDATLAAIEKAFAAQRFEIVLIEPIGLNIWNAITVREPDTNAAARSRCSSVRAISAANGRSNRRSVCPPATSATR